MYRHLSPYQRKMQDREIRKLFDTGLYTREQLSEKYQLHPTSISKILRTRRGAKPKRKYVRLHPRRNNTDVVTSKKQPGVLPPVQGEDLARRKEQLKEFIARQKLINEVVDALLHRVRQALQNPL